MQYPFGRNLMSLDLQSLTVFFRQTIHTYNYKRKEIERYLIATKILPFLPCLDFAWIDTNPFSAYISSVSATHGTWIPSPHIFRFAVVIIVTWYAALSNIFLGGSRGRNSRRVVALLEVFSTRLVTANLTHVGTTLPTVTVLITTLA